jgi:hypothetical protein
MKHSSTWFASILRKWASRLSRENVKEENQTTSTEWKESQPQADETAPVIRAVVDVGNTFLNEYRRNNKEQTAAESKNQTIATWAVCAGLALAAIGLIQAVLTRQSNQVALDTLHITERPYMSSMMRTNAIGDDGKLELAFTNTGKLPATDMNEIVYVAREFFSEGVPEGLFGQQKTCYEAYSLESNAIQDVIVTLKPWDAADWEGVENGREAIFVGLEITFNDGFNEDGSVVYRWCTQYSFDLRQNRLNWLTCPTGQLEWLKAVNAQKICNQ